MWNGQQMQRMVVVDTDRSGNHVDPNNTPFPQVPEDATSFFTFRDDVSFALTTSGHFYVSVNRSNYHLRDSSLDLNSNVTAVCFTGAILALGTADGFAVVYRISQPDDLLNFNLRAWYWKGRHGGRHRVQAVEAKVTMYQLGVSVVYMKDKGLYAHHLSHAANRQAQAEQDRAEEERERNEATE